MPTTTPNLNLTYLASAQSQPEVPINDAWNKIDAAVAAAGGGASTVAALPAAPVPGQRSFVTDATAVIFLTAVVGGGVNRVPVVYDGSHWLIG